MPFPPIYRFSFDIFDIPEGSCELIVSPLISGLSLRGLGCYHQNKGHRGDVWFQYLFWLGPIICFLRFSIIVVLKWPLTRCIARSSFWASRLLPDRWIFGCLYQTFWWLLKKPNSTFANAARNKLTQISQNPWSLSISLPYLKFLVKIWWSQE